MLDHCILYSTFSTIAFFYRLRKTSKTASHLSASTSQTHSPAIMIESGRLNANQNTVKPVPKLSSLKSLHKLKKDLISIFISENIDKLIVSYSFERSINALVNPINGDTLKKDIAWKFPNCIGGKLKKDPLGYPWTFLQVKKFIAKLDDIISEAVHNKLINIESYLSDKLSSDMFQRLIMEFFLSFQLS